MGLPTLFFADENLINEEAHLTASDYFLIAMLHIIDTPWNAVFTAIDENTVGLEPFSTEVGISFTEEDEPDPDTGYYRKTTPLDLGLHITEHPTDQCKLRIELSVAKDGTWWNVLDGTDYVDVPKPDNPFEPLSCDYFYVGNIVCVDDDVPLVEAS